MNLVTITKDNFKFGVNTDLSLAKVQDLIPNFFKTKFGKRETFEMYRGFLIVRHTLDLSGGVHTRETVIYLVAVYTEDQSVNPIPDTYFAGYASSSRSARSWIDHIIKKGKID